MKPTRRQLGRHSELQVASELIGLGLHVYFPFVDERGVDFVIRVETEKGLKYYDIQIKSIKGYNLVIGLPKHRVREKGPNYIVIVHFRHDDKPDEYIYFTREQLLKLLPEGAEWGDFPLKKAQRESFRHQDLKHLAEWIASN